MEYNEITVKNNKMYYWFSEHNPSILLCKINQIYKITIKSYHIEIFWKVPPFTTFYNIALTAHNIRVLNEIFGNK